MNQSQDLEKAKIEETWTKQVTVMVGCLTPPGAKNRSGCDLSPSGSFPSEEPAFYYTLLWKRRLGKTQDVAWEIQLFLSPSKSDQQHDYAALPQHWPSRPRHGSFIVPLCNLSPWWNVPLRVEPPNQTRRAISAALAPFSAVSPNTCPRMARARERVSRDIAKFSFMLWCWKLVCSFIIKLSLKAARLPGRAALRNACSALANLLLRNSHYPGNSWEQR